MPAPKPAPPEHEARMTERDKRAARRAIGARHHDALSQAAESEASEMTPVDEAQQASTNQPRLLADMSVQLAEMDAKLKDFDAKMVKREAALVEREELVARQKVVDCEHNERVLREAATVAAEARAQADLLASMSAQLNSLNAKVVEPPNHLLSLPVELRAQIYRFVLGEKWQYIGGIRTRGKGGRPTSWRIHDGRPPLALTCKIIRRELLDVFYAETEFYLGLRQTPEYTQSLLNGWEASMGKHASSVRLVEFDRVLKPLSDRPHPHEPGWYLKDQKYRVKARLTAQGAIDINCTLYSVVWTTPWQEHDHLVEQYCECHLRRFLQASTAQGVDGRRLISLARACMKEGCSEVTGAICEDCKLPTVDITVASVVDIDDSD
ncbi:hypothetical protein LTR97_002677 [Elasticomyces elasticus]|uniref:Uncharacterized protein n=1 Tax=Elasticomyces elasticus TaxID=574655 RepID=A0AAN7WBU3_9PEZI|nr:hypothetical protein LTR97_002677 [Elasticomyces elasticus]